MRDTIKKHEDFHTSDTDPIARSVYFFVRAKRAKYPENPRVGFMATKRTFKLATDRNRAKRLLRDWVRYYSNKMLDKYDYIFIAREPILRANREDGRYAMALSLDFIAKKRPRPKNVKKTD